VFIFGVYLVYYCFILHFLTLSNNPRSYITWTH